MRTVSRGMTHTHTHTHTHTQRLPYASGGLLPPRHNNKTTLALILGKHSLLPTDCACTKLHWNLQVYVYHRHNAVLNQIMLCGDLLRQHLLLLCFNFFVRQLPFLAPTCNSFWLHLMLCILHTMMKGLWDAVWINCGAYTKFICTVFCHIFVAQGAL